jgi:glutamate-1-semialdehyde 2,1-aminomutase
MTGFRVSRGGAQQLYGIQPDLTTLGKIIGGGLPVGAYGGRREIMKMVSPSGPVYQAGTLSGNPLTMAAGYETLRVLLNEDSFYAKLESRCRMLEDGIRSDIASLSLPLSYTRVGSMATLFFTSGPVTDYRTALNADTKRFAAYFREMLALGISLPPSQFEASFVSAAHSESDIRQTIAANRQALAAAFQK